jgi:hypothetical protein
MRLILALVLLLGVSACVLGREPSARPTGQPSAGRNAPDLVVPRQPDASGTGACAEVRAGINEFNRGRYERTIAHFRVALRLAKQQFRTDPTGGAEDLVEAVTYYAELPAKDYPDSARSSTQFAKYKAITLGQCVSQTDPLEDGTTESPGVTA